MAVTVEQVREALKECYDPHMPYSVLDLGLIYDIRIEGETVEVDMTLTNPGCPMAAVITDDVKSHVEDIEGVKEAKINVVFDPPWNPEMMSDEAKQQLGIV